MSDDNENIELTPLLKSLIGKTLLTKVGTFKAKEWGWKYIKLTRTLIIRISVDIPPAEERRSQLLKIRRRIDAELRELE